MEPNNSDAQGIRERLEKLERQNRRLEQAAVIALLVLSSLVLMAQTSTHKTVEANAFFLVDENGNRRAELSFAHGVPGLTIYGGGEGKVWLAASNSGSLLSLQAPDGKASASLNAGAVLGLLVSDDKGTIELNVYKAHPSLSMDGVDGTASLRVVGRAGPTLTLAGADGLSSSLDSHVLGVNSGEDGFASLGVIREHGPVLAVMDGQGFRSVLGVTKTVSTGTGEQHQTSAAALTMFDKEGKVIWSEP